MPRDLSDLKSKKFALTGPKTVNNPNAPDGKVDMYLLYEDTTGEGIISIGVPHGRDDIAQFILRSMKAGQKVLIECNINDITRFMPY